ncbi:PREDICTED: uncharacterized protein LOC105964573 [Erythranthe guttata]|uniref:uncharacterized protein LOC105964573 n=1 Tax=Erythranthe guttata TaxID=4155 RepID=UPI00064D9FE5|nr:PREDICTED: uncharacterized protein LOC105964573 [Erythranthe guttata]|eukprot:XP_012844535.1 PREDICTED: uncharacterized protein LOC105964573 [Erythranthe guttata]
MQPIDSPIPFAQWGVDLVGHFPPATGERKFLIVVVDYFTKWVEAEPLARIRETRLGSAKGKCVEELPSALWAYRTTSEESSFKLAFEIEVVAPIEIGEPSWRVTNYSPKANEEAMRARINLVDELREITSIR